jgi:hypothetical protein
MARWRKSTSGVITGAGSCDVVVAAVWPGNSPESSRVAATLSLFLTSWTSTKKVNVEMAYGGEAVVEGHEDEAQNGGQAEGRHKTQPSASASYLDGFVQSGGEWATSCLHLASSGANTFLIHRRTTCTGSRPTLAICRRRQRPMSRVNRQGLLRSMLTSQTYVLRHHRFSVMKAFSEAAGTRACLKYDII